MTVTDPRWDILHLLHRYAELIDAGEFDAVGALLAGAEVSAEGRGVVATGAEQAAGLFAATTRRYDDGTPRTKHVVTNAVIGIDDGGATASARSYFTVFQAVPDSVPLQPVIAGRYDDRFALVDGAWAFVARHITIDLVGDLSAHLRFEL